MRSSVDVAFVVFGLRKDTTDYGGGPAPVTGSGVQGELPLRFVITQSSMNFSFTPTILGVS